WPSPVRRRDRGSGLWLRRRTRSERSRKDDPPKDPVGRSVADPRKRQLRRARRDPHAARAKSIALVGYSAIGSQHFLEHDRERKPRNRRLDQREAQLKLR